MARIPTDELERLKQEVFVQRLAENRGITLKRHGADLIGLCPFHDDHEPSLVISPKKNLWHCLGACQSGGSVIDWAMKAEGVSFRHAVELLQADYQPSFSRFRAGETLHRAETAHRAGSRCRGCPIARKLNIVLGKTGRGTTKGVRHSVPGPVL